MAELTLAQEETITAQAEAAARVINAFAQKLSFKIPDYKAGLIIQAFAEALFRGNFVGRQFSIAPQDMYRLAMNEKSPL